MIEIVKSVPLTTVLSSDALLEKDTAIYALVHEKEIYVMSHEVTEQYTGYIFRRANDPKWGHSGQHSTQKQCIEHAIANVPSSRVFQFSSFVELARFIVNQISFEQK